VFSLHGITQSGAVALRKTVRRDQLADTVVRIAPCLIGMEACPGAHEWRDGFRSMGVPYG